MLLQQVMGCRLQVHSKQLQHHLETTSGFNSSTNLTLLAGHVHLPVAGYDFLSCHFISPFVFVYKYFLPAACFSSLSCLSVYLSSAQATPEAPCPQRNSKGSSPPVEIWLILSPSPIWLTAAAGSSTTDDCDSI